MSSSYTLYAAPLSLYSGKARGYLRWKNVAYKEVLATRQVYVNEILPRVGWPVMPVLIAPDDTTVQDTTDIIDYVETHEPGPSIYPEGPKQKLAALIMELFGDEWLLMAAMYYRWTFNEEFAYGEFGNALYAELPLKERAAKGREDGARFKSFLPFLGITPNTAPAIEATYEEFLKAFDIHLSKHNFLFGSRPSIGDYGLLGPLYAHNYRDPASGEHMEKTAPRVAAWCRYTHAPQHFGTGEFIENDEIPETLIPILKMFAREQLPILLSTIEQMKTWYAANPDEDEVPRAIGMHEYTIGGVTDNRGVIPYPLWMLQRVTDHLASLSGKDKTAANELLASIGAKALIDLNISPRLTRKNFKLHVA